SRSLLSAAHPSEARSGLLGRSQRVRWIPYRYAAWTLAFSGGPASDAAKGVEEGERDMATRHGRGRPFIMPTLPEMFAHGGEHVGEGRFRFRIPLTLLDWQPLGMQALGHQDDQAEDAEQAGRRPFDGP